MDRSEHIVESYLRSLGFSNVAYEPDGNVPPDFLVDGRIAVEVRRLNQNVKSVTGGTEGIEETFLPIWQAIHRFLPTLGPSINGESWFVGIRLRRPLESWRMLKPLVGYALRDFMSSQPRKSKIIKVTRHFEMVLQQGDTSHASFFLLGSGLDFDAGGFVLAEVFENLRLCVSEKERKIAPYRHKYPLWWLVLPDHIGYGLDAEGRRQFRELPALEHSWDKIVLLNPMKPSHAFEV